MNKDELAAWMLKEHEKIHELIEELREKVTVAPRGDRAQWIEGLCNRFDDFAAHIRQHLKLEEQGGYLAQVVKLRPTLSEAVEIIEHEHEELEYLLAELQTALRELKPTDTLIFRDGCKRVQHFLTWLDRHEEHENHIMLYAFTQDIGTAG